MIGLRALRVRWPRSSWFSRRTATLSPSVVAAKSSAHALAPHVFSSARPATIVGEGKRPTRCNFYIYIGRRSRHVAIRRAGIQRCRLVRKLNPVEWTL
jgi:hypothetical protein